jgi:pre-mRNA-processing factor SLU7
VGIEAAEASSAQQLLASSTQPPQPPQQKLDPEDSAERVERVDQNYSKKRIGEGDVKLDPDRLAQSILDEKKRKSMKDGDDRSSKKQKSGLGTGSHEVTEEELGTFLLCLFFCNLLLTYRCRGLPDEPTDDRRSHGQLR